MSCCAEVHGTGRKRTKQGISHCQRLRDALIEQEADIRVLLDALHHENCSDKETWQEISLKRQLMEIQHQLGQQN